MRRLAQIVRPSLPWWALYFSLVLVADLFWPVPWDIKALLILSGVALGAAVRRLAW